MKLAQGHTIVTIPVIILFISSILFTIVFPHYWLTVVFTTLLLIFVIQFFRDPERSPESNDLYIVLAPADGVLFEIIQDEFENQIFRIRMRFWDVHVNRMPLNGIVYSNKLVSGLYLPIIPGINKISKTKNAHQILQFRHPSGFDFKVVQRSGILAYRCVSYWQISDQVIQKGLRIGMIRFGSETDLYIPKERIKNVITIGSKVRACQTVLCQLKDTTSD